MYDQNACTETTPPTEPAVWDIASRLSIRSAMAASLCAAILGMPEGDVARESPASITTALYSAEACLDTAIGMLDTIYRRLGCAI